MIPSQFITPKKWNSKSSNLDILFKIYQHFSTHSVNIFFPVWDKNYHKKLCIALCTSKLSIKLLSVLNFFECKEVLLSFCSVMHIHAWNADNKIEEYTNLTQKCWYVACCDTEP